MKVDDVISKFKHLHMELEVVPSSAAYEKLIGHCCNSLKVLTDLLGIVTPISF